MSIRYRRKGTPRISRVSKSTHHSFSPFLKGAAARKPISTRLGAAVLLLHFHTLLTAAQSEVKFHLWRLSFIPSLRKCKHLDSTTVISTLNLLILFITSVICRSSWRHGTSPAQDCQQCGKCFSNLSYRWLGHWIVEDHDSTFSLAGVAKSISI